MNKLIACFILSLLLLPRLVLGDGILTQDAFIRQAVSSNPSYQISAQEYLVALEQDSGARSLEDWNLVLSGLWYESKPAAISVLSAQYQKTTGYTIGLEKYIAETGTAIQIEHGNNRIDSEYGSAISIPGVGTLDFNPPSKYYLSSVSLTIVQPLLKNAFGLAAKNALKMSNYSLELAKLKMSEDWEDFIGLLKGEYLTWQKCVKNVSLVKSQVAKVEDQLVLTKKQMQYGLSEELDVVQLKQKLEAYKIMLEQAKLACETQERKIFQLMGMAGVSNENVGPQKFVPGQISMDESTATSFLVASSNIKKTADILVELQTTNLETKENAKLMDVSLVLSSKPNAYSEGFSNSLSTIGTYNENTISLTASRPLGNDQAEAEAKQAQIEYAKALKERENILLNANIGLSSLYTSLGRLANMIDLNQASLELAKKRLVLEKKKFNQGRSSIYFVLQAEDDLLRAENSLNETVFAREGIINQIYTITDQYLVEYKDVLKL